MTECKLVSIGIPAGGGGELSRSARSADGRVSVDITEYPYVSSAITNYLKQDWQIAGSNVGRNSVVLLLTR